MPLPYNAKLKERSIRLRHEMTDAEKRLWEKIRVRQIGGYWFYRQKPIGDYIVDFYCPKVKLIIEVDGGQHLSGEVAENDKVRDEYLKSLGLKVFRFTNTDILKNINGVVERIAENMAHRGPKLPLSLFYKEGYLKRKWVAYRHLPL